MDEKKNNKHVTIIESSDNNVNNNNNGSKTSMDILADLATALVDKGMESLLPNSLVKLLDDTKLATASEYYERAIKAMKQKSESINDSSSSSSPLDRKAIALSSVVFTVGRPFSSNGFLLSQLADHARVSLEALLYPLLGYIELLDMTKEYEETVKATNDRFVMCSLLHERYTRIICRTEDISKESALGPSLPNDKKGLYRILMIRLGWLLFVLLKDSDMFSEDELRDKLYHVLLCCANFVSMNSPLGMFATESEDKNSSGGVKSYYSFEALCAQDSMPYAETLDVQDTMFRTFVKRLCGDGLLAVKSLGNTRSAAQRDFIPLEVLRTALTNLDNTYSEKLSFSGEFDERYFQRDLSMFSASQQQQQPQQPSSSAVATTPIRSSAVSNNSVHPLFTGDLRARHAPLPTPVAKSTPSRMGATSSSFFLSTPAPPPPPTPVRTKVSMLKWLDGLMRVQPGPGPVLSRLLRENGAEEQAAALNAKVEELAAGLGLAGTQKTVLHQQKQQHQSHIPPLPPALPFPIPLGSTQFSTINTQNSIINIQNSIIKTQNSIINTQNNTINIQNSIINNQNNTINTQNNTINTQNSTINNNSSNEISNNSNNNNDNDNNFIVHDPSKRVELCMRLFYMLLDSLIAREIHTKRMNIQSSASKSRLPGATGGDAKEMLDAVFSTESLVRAVLAVAAEIVAYAARNTALAFPAVIRALKLQPSEFFRILINIFSLNDLFQFPYEASAHLRSIEAALVDTFVWESTSSSLPIYADTPSTEIISIAEAVTAAPALRGPVPAEARSVPSTPERNHSSVVSVSLPPKTVASTEITTDVPLTISTTVTEEKTTINNNNNGNNEQKKDAVMHRGFAILLRRLFILSAEKFELLCKDYPQELVNQMWYVFVHTVAEHKDLLPGHTGTQLVLCAYAGVMRSNGRTADLHAAAATLLHGSSPPSAVCAGVPISSLSIQAPAEKKTGTLHDYYNTIYARSVSSVLHKAKFLFRVKSSTEGGSGGGSGAGEKGEEKQQKRVQPAILLQSCRKPLGVRSTRSGSAMLSPRRLMFKQTATPSSSSSSSTFSSSSSTVFPQSPYRSLSLFTEVKVRPNKRSLSGTTLFPQRTLNFDDMGGGGNEYADDEKSESSDPEKERGGNGKKKKKKNDDDEEEKGGGGIDTKKPRYALNELDF